MEVRLRAETQPGPPLCHVAADMKGELYILSPEEEFLCTQCCCCTVLWFSGPVSINNDISLLHHPPRKLCLFSSLSLCFLDFFFPLSPWVLLAAINAVRPPPWPSQEPSDLSGLESDGPPLELSLVFECLWPFITWSSLPAWLSWEPSDLSGFNSDCPPWPSCTFPPWTHIRTVYALLSNGYLLYIVCIACHILFPMSYYTIVRILLLDMFQMLLIASYHHVVQFNCFPFNYCSITVWLLFAILIIEMYSRYFDLVTRKLYLSPSSIHKSIIIIQYSTSLGYPTYFNLYILCPEGLLPK